MLTYVYSIKISLGKNLNINSVNKYIFLSHLEDLISRINNIINFTKIPHKWIIFNEEVVYWENLLDVQRDEVYLKFKFRFYTYFKYKRRKKK